MATDDDGAKGAGEPDALGVERRLNLGVAWNCCCCCCCWFCCCNGGKDLGVSTLVCWDFLGTKNRCGVGVCGGGGGAITSRSNSGSFDLSSVSTTSIFNYQDAVTLIPKSIHN